MITTTKLDKPLGRVSFSYLIFANLNPSLPALGFLLPAINPRINHLQSY